MFSLSSREQILVIAVILAFVLGVSVKHWRDANRESMAARTPAATRADAAGTTGLPVAQTQGRAPHP